MALGQCSLPGWGEEQSGKRVSEPCHVPSAVPGAEGQVEARGSPCPWGTWQEVRMEAQGLAHRGPAGEIQSCWARSRERLLLPPWRPHGGCSQCTGSGSRGRIHPKRRGGHFT